MPRPNAGYPDPKPRLLPDLRFTTEILVPEARLDPFGVTPLLAWDSGEVSGPSNLQATSLKGDHVLDLIETLDDLEMVQFLKALETRIGTLDWKVRQKKAERAAVKKIRETVG